MEEKEIWKDITGYEGLYQISNLGRIKSLERKVKDNYGYRIVREKILNCRKQKNGYLAVYLYKNGKQKTIKVHRLVAYAFVKNDSLFNNEINHIDENKLNNCASNLQWCEHIYNMNYGTRTERASKSNTNNPKFSKRVKCLETGIVYPSISEIKRQLGFGIENISQCCNGKLKSAYKLHWKFVD